MVATTTVPPKPPPVDTRAFDAALAQFVAHDAKGDWSKESCSSVAADFDAVATKDRLPEARYDAALAWERCGDRTQAAMELEGALELDPKFLPARAELALVRRAAGDPIDPAITALEQVVVEAKFRDVGALVRLAALQLERGGATGSVGCASDFDCAKLNLQRALAIDDSYMPAFDQLALYYYRSALRRAKDGRADAQQLELAALVCSQAVRKDASYAPIHNTAGLIQSQLGNASAASAEFTLATKLDPRSFEAQMNLALLNLSFRGFAAAEKALRVAVALRPLDYDAHLALALALRGQLTWPTPEQIAAVQAELDRCKIIAPTRPDAYYNEAILTHQFKAKGSTDDATLRLAKTQYEGFVQRAGNDPKYATAVKRSRGDGALDRGAIGDIEDTLVFLGAPAPPPAPATPVSPKP